MLAHVETLVAGVDDQRVVQHIMLTQIVHKAAHIVIHGTSHLGIIAHVTLELVLREGTSRGRILVEGRCDGVIELVIHAAVGLVQALDIVQISLAQTGGIALAVYLVVIHDVHIVGRTDGHLLLLGGYTALPIVPEVAGQGECLVLIGAQILHGGQPVAVTSLVMHKEDEGFVLVAMLHPVDGLVGDDVGTVALGHLARTVHLDECGVVVFALPVQNLVVIEARGLAHQVPLADEGCLITCLTHQLGHSLLASVKDTVLIVGKTILMAVLSCEHAGTAGARQAVGHITVAEKHTLTGQTVEVGCLDRAVAVCREHLCRMVIRHNIDDVGSLLGAGRHRKQHE